MLHHNKQEYFAILSHFHPCLIFAVKAGAYQGRGHNPNGRLPGLPPNIKLGWKKLSWTSTLAFYDKARITAIKSILERALAE